MMKALLSYAIGYTDNEYGKTVLTNSTLGSTYDIATGTSTSGNTSNWAMKLATNSSATYPITIDNSFNNYHVVPSPYAKVAHRDSGTDIGTGATGAELTSTYAAYMNQTQPAGTYSGKDKYTLVHPSSETPLQPVACDPSKICYNANSSTVVGEMGKQSASNNASVTLYASNFSRSGYGFLAGMMNLTTPATSMALMRPSLLQLTSKLTAYPSMLFGSNLLALFRTGMVVAH